MTPQDRVKFTGAIIASILFVLLIGFIELQENDHFAMLVQPDREVRKPIAVESPVDTPVVADCLDIEDEFVAKLDSSRSCRVDADCSLARFECPFECVASVSTSVLGTLEREEAAFQQSCGRCTSSCPQSLAKWRAACVRQRCIVMDRSIEELEEATLQRLNQ